MLLHLLLLASTSIITLAASSSSTTSAEEFILPPLHYSQAHSFRGVGQDGKISKFDVNGHASALPGVHDYLRLVPANPLNFGGLFSQTPLDAEEWVVEIAFRVHGPPAIGHVDVGEDGKTRKVHKGGRGLAFWFTKTANPSPVTISHDPKWPSRPPPQAIPDKNDESDDKVSLFGSRTKFDGLGVIFDTAPQAPLHRRSDQKYWSEEQTAGVGTSGVVSGILDDGTGNWLDPDGRVLGNDDEANYLDRAIGECEAAFRNAQGLLWTRISHINNTIRVDLDLAPHTTLSKAGRDYAHNCFSLPGVTLSPGSFVGVTGLASGNPEPDFIDIYAIDTFEVIKVTPVCAAIPAEDGPTEKMSNAPLEGTTEDAVSTIAHEMFLSQARMMEAIDSLARRVDYLSRSVNMNRAASGAPGAPGAPGKTDPNLIGRLSNIEATLTRLESGGIANGGGGGGDTSGSSESITHILQLHDKLMVELKAFGRKLDTTSGQSTATLGTLASRSAESLQLLQRATNSLEEVNTKVTSGGGWLTWVLGAIIVGGGLAWLRERRDGFGGGRGKKMI